MVTRCAARTGARRTLKNFKFSQAAVEILVHLSNRWRLSQTSVLEVLLREERSRNRANPPAKETLKALEGK
jgi:hypothetical protein